MARTLTRRQQWLGCGGCIVAFVGLGMLLVATARTLGLFVFAILVVLVPAIALYVLSERRRAVASFRAAHRDSGKDVVIVYTDSPHWKAYIETRWLPRWGHRAIVLDRSRPWRHDQPEARLWRAIAGSAEHTPVVIVVPPHGKVQIVRFWLAFRDFKHGKDRKLRDAEARLGRILGEPLE